MTLDDAIKHCHEMSEKLRFTAKQGRGNSDPYAPNPEECLECAEEHEQLADWLTELKHWQELKLVCAFDGYVIYKEADDDKVD